MEGKQKNSVKEIPLPKKSEFISLKVKLFLGIIGFIVMYILITATVAGQVSRETNKIRNELWDDLHEQNSRNGENMEKIYQKSSIVEVLRCHHQSRLEFR